MTAITREVTEKMKECVHGSLSGTMAFPELQGC